MVVLGLICLSEGMMVSNTITVVSETTEVWFWFLLFINCNGHDFHLIVSKSDFNLKLVGHDELVRFN